MRVIAVFRMERDSMKEVKIKFIGFWPEFVPDEYSFYRALQRNFRVSITDDADYVFCSIWGVKYDYCNFPQVRIMYSGENYIPDFNLVDYAITSYPIEFLDRHFYMPNCIDKYHHLETLETHGRSYGRNLLDGKQFFASFIAGHESEYSIRGDFFKQLSEYKRVESVGSFLNNQNDGYTVDFTNDSKTDFQRRCKFSLCFESTKHQGFITEKITDAFFADTIPVYYGSDTVSSIFNQRAFINISDYDSFDEAIARIIEIDQDDEEYLQMMNEPLFAEGFSPADFLQREEAFVCNIFDQNLDDAYRRSRVYWPQRFNDYLCEARMPDSISMKGLASAMGKRVQNRLRRK